MHTITHLKYRILSDNFMITSGPGDYSWWKQHPAPHTLWLSTEGDSRHASWTSVTSTLQGATVLRTDKCLHSFSNIGFKCSHTCCFGPHTNFWYRTWLISLPVHHFKQIPLWNCCRREQVILCRLFFCVGLFFLQLGHHGIQQKHRKLKNF